MSPPLAVAHHPLDHRRPPLTDIAQRLRHGFPGIAEATERTVLLEQIIAFAAVAERRLAEQQERIAHLESLSLTDELTGLGNLRAFHQCLRATLAAAQRHNERGVIAYIDLDGFKRINDDFGHEGGDTALRHFGRVLSENIRLSDFVARLHGDEFGVILPRAGLAEGTARARFLQRMVQANPLHYGGATLTLAASFGIAPFGPQTEADELLRRADKAMYREKRARMPSDIPQAAAE